MATVSGEIRIVTDVAAPVSQVWVSAPKMRAEDGAVIAAFHDRFNVREGRVSFNCRPGPARVTLVLQVSRWIRWIFSCPLRRR